MMMKTPIIAGMAGFLALSACVNPDAYPNDPNARQRMGVVAGALTGAAVGASSGDDRLAKAAIGGLVGGVVGGAIGSSLDRQAAELRAQMSPGVSVTNHGDYLLVNMPQDLLFATDSATLSGSIVGDIAAVARNLVQYPGSTVQVIGHTDSTGSAAYNQDLSQRRAQSVAGILTAAGVNGNRIVATGRGASQPIASNDSVQGRAQNRRVEILIRPTQ